MDEHEQPIFTNSIINNKQHKKPIPKKQEKTILVDSIPDKKSEFLDKFLSKKWIISYFNNKSLLYEGKQKK